MEERIALKRFVQASQGVNTCLPDDSGAQSISSGLLTTCSTSLAAASVFALQVWKAICWLWGEIQTVLARLTTDETNITNLQGEVATLQGQMATAQGDITTIEAEVAALTPRTPGGVTFVTHAGAGSGASIVGSGNDRAGHVSITIGTGQSAAALFSVVFDTPYATPGTAILIAADAPAGGQLVPWCAANTTDLDATAAFSGLSPGTKLDYYYLIIGGT